MPIVNDTEPTPSELSNLGEALQTLWRLDVNRFQPGQDYELNLQESKKTYDKEDAAAARLFTRVNKDKFFSIPSYAAFYNLLDNYVAEVGKNEVLTSMETGENRRFIDAICETPVIRYMQRYLMKKNLIDGNVMSFKKLLEKLWFNFYGRGSGGDSSAFEHVFLGEVRQDKVIGFHNWVTLFLEERKNFLDYQGFITPRNRSHPLSRPTGQEHIGCIQFKWKNVLKPMSTTLFGVSPEFEIALYTLSFLCGKERTPTTFGDIDVNVVCYDYNHHSDRSIGSAYVELINY
ncbi:hypothetical protein K493DRAFT_298040 [Basidiobolus meristosporus CBS 931.73]|uniref:EndoU domain-containing protein n=1 Tax=Basidiobolus meristosporus CBS 931.73 TaxID=1314790 RepID=A0A1Y1YVR2_9FUNG|nr:hypothetical protein K493DRAFT_298040 [Basidiobolus meristosporus CBS 931.73]|eukprot:ORY02153.1 hypothetical protein K493DRAFT_298040 [Basidiobolus meristosporus CBS 931.73]